MDLLAFAVPFFIMALCVELAYDRFKGTGYFRTNDAINSLSTGILSTTFGYFTRFLPAIIWAYALQNFALFEIDVTVFDASPTGLVYWLIALLAYDFCYYWAHRCGHEMSVLWAAHAVHHQSEDYNLSTALRQTGSGFLFSWVFYLPLFFLGMPIEIFITVNALDLIYQFWVHTQHIGRLGWVDYVLVTPSNHRVHHAQNEVYIDKNYGGILILWDRFFGTFQDELEAEPVVFGVRKPLQSWNPFWANVQVYRYLWFDAAGTARWRDKLAIWFKKTGWRPADMEAKFPREVRAAEEFKKYDPKLTSSTRRYLVVQYTAVVAAVLWISMLYATVGLTAVVAPCLFVWLTLYVIGLLSEASAYGKKAELLRLVLFLPVTGLAMGVELRADIVLAVLTYVAASMLLLPGTMLNKSNM